MICFCFVCLFPPSSAIVEQYLLEKSRIVSQAANERNYHVFYYLLKGANDAEKQAFWLEKPQEYFYLNQVGYWQSIQFNFIDFILK